MNSYQSTGQGVSKNPGLDLTQAQDLIADIVHLQRFLSIANALQRETFLEIDPSFALLLEAYEDSAVPEKLQVVLDLIEGAKRALP